MMNNPVTSFVARLLVVAVSTAGGSAFGQASPADAFKAIQAMVQEKRFDEAIAQIERMLKTPDLHENEKVRFLRFAAETSNRRKAPEEAVAFFERIVADPGIGNRAKINALQDIANARIAGLAGQDLSDMDLAPAHAVLERAMTFPDLTPEDRAQALKAIGKLFERQDDYDGARETYQRILSLEVNDRSRAEAEKLIADVDAAQGNSAAAIEVYRRHGFDLIDLYRRIGDDAARRAECERILDDPAAADPARWNAFGKLPCWDGQSRDLDAIRQACEKYLPAFMEQDANRALVLQRKFNDRSVEDPALVEFAAPLLVQAPRLSDKDYESIQTRRIEALVAQGKTQPAVRAAGEMTGDPRIAPAMRFWAGIVSSVLRSDDIAAVEKFITDEKALPASEKAESILHAARTALRAGDEASARTLHAAYEALLNRPARASIVCAFVPDAPFDVGSWLASPIRKDAASHAKLDRPYGDNLQILLETDSAVTGRNTAAGQKEATGDQDGDLHIACDDEGIHLFLLAHDQRAAEVRNGLVGGGAYEMYLAPGEHQPYFLFLLELPGGELDPDAFITMYPNARFRLPSKDDGTLRTDTQAVPEGFASHLFLSWELFYDKLPVNGSKWQLDAIRWTRSGGLSFGGSESVHNRSSWGDVVFSGLSDENLTAIKRRILFKAVAKYRKARTSVGPAIGWADPDLGDPAFYRSHVEPLIQRLDAHAAGLSSDLSAEEVDRLYAQAVPEWMELQYHVAALRTHYLQDKHLDGDRP